MFDYNINNYKFSKDVTFTGCLSTLNTKTPDRNVNYGR